MCTYVLNLLELEYCMHYKRQATQRNIIELLTRFGLVMRQIPSQHFAVSSQGQQSLASHKLAV